MKVSLGGDPNWGMVERGTREGVFGVLGADEVVTGEGERLEEDIMASTPPSGREQEQGYDNAATGAIVDDYEIGCI
jgi:hypothetical protein